MQVAFPRRERGIYTRPCQDQARKKVPLWRIAKDFHPVQSNALVDDLVLGLQETCRETNKAPLPRTKLQLQLERSCCMILACFRHGHCMSSRPLPRDKGLLRFGASALENLNPKGWWKKGTGEVEWFGWSGLDGASWNARFHYELYGRHYTKTSKINHKRQRAIREYWVQKVQSTRKRVWNQRCSGLNRQVTQSQSSSKSFTCLLESFESIAQLFACFPSIDDGCRADRSFGCKTCCENCTFACWMRPSTSLKLPTRCSKWPGLGFFDLVLPKLFSA